MSAASEKMPVQCPQCGKQLMVPSTAAGKQGRCPACQNVFVLPTLVAAVAVDEEDQELRLSPLASDPFGQNAQASGQLQPLAAAFTPAAAQSPFQQGYAQAPNPYMAAAQAQAAQNQGGAKYNHGFGLEHRGWDMGMVGGLLMMLIAVVWFVGAAFFDIWFIYPPILFIIGLVGFVRGLFTGNISGSSS
jgi:hypothetical protein